MYSLIAGKFGIVPIVDDSKLCSGVMTSDVESVTAQGYDLQFGVNALGMVR